ncbi:hypothetical protein PILCRDRAFT_752700 [Piloderma croceum F 1598]|uniref:Uncharacterized protein n=1 Tax=Piloderma croceum (strain F 1598) TaxID=765440 RepID=A0A0C3EUP3_PILCF|nr:hypothetical protein PILCRDRAFT_752700 [Piloderma croceum F 1598]
MTGINERDANMRYATVARDASQFGITATTDGIFNSNSSIVQPLDRVDPTRECSELNRMDRYRGKVSTASEATTPPVDFASSAHHIANDDPIRALSQLRGSTFQSMDSGPHPNNNTTLVHPIYFARPLALALYAPR